MKDIKLLEELKEYPLFTPNDVARITDEGLNYTYLLLHRLEERGLIYRIKKGCYTIHEDPLIFASHLVTPSYFSLWTALRFYDFTTQVPTNVFVMTPVKRMPVRVFNTEILFIKTRHVFGYEKKKVSGLEVFMADPEKLLVDCLLTHRVPVSELDELLTAVNPGKVVDYTKRVGVKALAKRVGFLLEEKGKSSKGLLELVDSNYALLDSNLPEKGDRNRKWKIIKNCELPC